MNKFEISNLDLYYGQLHALKDVELKIQERQITAFIGPSGCGKSTLLRTLNRMNDLVEGCRITGNVLLDGQDIYNGSLDTTMLRKRVGMVFQKPNPFPMSVYDNVAYGPRTHGIRGKAKLEVGTIGGSSFRPKYSRAQSGESGASVTAVRSLCFAETAFRSHNQHPRTAKIIRQNGPQPFTPGSFV